MKLPFHAAAAVSLLFVIGCHAPGGAEAPDGTSQGALQAGLDPTWTPADEQLAVPTWTGNDEEGSLLAPMYRGASQGIEDWVYAPPDGDCTDARGVMRIDWSKLSNVVRYQVKYKKIPPRPSVHRKEGVDWFADPVHQAPRDFNNGGYRFWTILAAQSFLNDFYYDATTLAFVGSQYDFPGGQPTGTIKAQIPVFGLLTNHLMFPKEDGSLFHEWTMPYDAVQVEGGPWSLGIATYIPLTLCEANEFQPISGQLRPWAGPWLTHDQVNMTWGDLLKRGLVFDTTVDENKAFPELYGYEPYIWSGVAFMGNQPAFQGGIPRGWRNNLASVIQQVAPGIRVLEGGGAGPGCRPFLMDPHLDGPNHCASSATTR